MIIRLLDDVEEAREIHSLAFPYDSWVGNSHTFWVATHGRKTVGFCSALYSPTHGEVFLSRAAATAASYGKGYHRRMIDARIAWAHEEGAKAVVTYTMLKNYPSMMNLLHCGLKFVEIPREQQWFADIGEPVHFFQRDL